MNLKEQHEPNNLIGGVDVKKYISWEARGELENLEEDLRSGSMHIDRANNYLDEYEYEFDYSHREIEEFQSEFKDEAEAYLKENYTGLFAIKLGVFCVHIITVECMKQKNLKRWTIC